VVVVVVDAFWGCGAFGHVFVRLPTVCAYLFVAAEVSGVTYLLASLASEGIGSLCFRVED
jgi:hypothetical protein